MTARPLMLLLLEGRFAVCRLEPVPDGIPCERGWRCLRVAGTIEFSVASAGQDRIIIVWDAHTTEQATRPVKEQSHRSLLALLVWLARPAAPSRPALVALTAQTPLPHRTNRICVVLAFSPGLLGGR
jgi:hypothetical protein